MRYKIKSFWTELDPDSSFAWKGDFLGELYYFLPIVPHYATMSQKNTGRS